MKKMHDFAHALASVPRLLARTVVHGLSRHKLSVAQ